VIEGRPGGPDPAPPLGTVRFRHFTLRSVRALTCQCESFARRHGLVALSRPHAAHAHSCPLHVCGGQQEPLQMPVAGAGVCLPQAQRVRGEGTSALSSRFPGHPSLHLFSGELSEPWMRSPLQSIVTWTRPLVVVVSVSCCRNDMTTPQHRCLLDG
jgi:hypothetical protein